MPAQEDVGRNHQRQRQHGPGNLHGQEVQDRMATVPGYNAGWFLTRMPGRTGMFLGLTGTRMNPADASNRLIFSRRWSVDNGLVRKSSAPAFKASTAWSTVPKAVITIKGMPGCSAC